LQFRERNGSLKLGKVTKVLLAALAVLALVAGCGGGGGESGGGGGGSGGGELTLGVAGGWTENEAVSNLSKVILEEDLGYDEVAVETADLGLVFQGVASGDYDAFQDVWMPNHSELLSEVEGDVEQLDPWFRGTTKFSIAVPTYVETEDGEQVTSIDQLNQTDIEQIIGIEPGAIIMTAIPENTIPEYGLEQELVESSTQGMLSEVENRYEAEEDFAFIAWSPHWMNTRFDFNYLEDPKTTLTNEAGDSLTEPSELSSIVRADLQEEDPVAYAFLDELTLTEQQVNELEDEIVTAGDPVEGSRAWLEGNRDVVQPWVDAAERAQGG
jgi:glycine betaine/proline transport system substrate-binding protein